MVSGTGLSTSASISRCSTASATARRKSPSPTFSSSSDVLDLWVHQWRRRHPHRLVSVVRYAADFVMELESEADPGRMLVDLKHRMTKFGLLLHEAETRLIEFGRLPARARR